MGLVRVPGNSSIIPLNLVRSECIANGNVINAKNPQGNESDIPEMDSRTLLEHLKNIEKQGKPEDCQQAISQTAIWLQKHPDEPYVRRQYLILVREKGLLEQQQATITQTTHWLQGNLQNRDSYVFTEYLKLIRNPGTPEDQCHEAIELTSTWLSDHPDESYVLRQYFALVRERGKSEQCQEVILQTASWLEANLTKYDSYMFWEYLRLVNQEGTLQQRQKAIEQATIWLQANPDNSYIRSEYLKLMRSQR